MHGWYYSLIWHCKDLPSTFLHICVKFRNWNFNDSSHTSLYSCSVCAVKLCTPYFIVLPLQFQETHLTYNVVCYSKYSTLNSLAFLFICFYLSFYIFILLSHLFLSFSLILFLSPSLIFIVYWTLVSLYSFCWTLLDFTFSSTSLLAQQNVSERLTFYANCTSQL